MSNVHIYPLLESYCRQVADEWGIYLSETLGPSYASQTIDNMLQLLIYAGILSFGWGKLYQVSRHNCSVCLLAAPFLEIPYVLGGGKRGSPGEAV